MFPLNKLAICIYVYNDKEDALNMKIHFQYRLKRNDGNVSIDPGNTSILWSKNVDADNTIYKTFIEQ